MEDQGLRHAAALCLRLIDSCTTQLKAQGPYRSCNESIEEEAEFSRGGARGFALLYHAGPLQGYFI